MLRMDMHGTQMLTTALQDYCFGKKDNGERVLVGGSLGNKYGCPFISDMGVRPSETRQKPYYTWL